MYSMVLEIFLVTIAIYVILVLVYRTCDKNATMLFSVGFVSNVTYLIDFLLTYDSVIMYLVSATAAFMMVAYHVVKK